MDDLSVAAAIINRLKPSYTWLKWRNGSSCRIFDRDFLHYFTHKLCNCHVLPRSTVDTVYNVLLLWRSLERAGLIVALIDHQYTPLTAVAKSRLQIIPPVLHVFTVLTWRFYFQNHCIFQPIGGSNVRNAFTLM